MKKMAVLLFTDIEHDSRVQRTVDVLSGIFNIDIFCRDNKTSIDSMNLKFFHNRYSDNDANIFESREIFSVKFIRKLIYYIDTEKMKFRSIIDSRYNVYYCNDFNTLIAGFIASRKKRAKLIYDSHELWTERSGAKNTIFNRVKWLFEMTMEYILIRKCDIVITVSQGIASEMSRRYNISEPLVIRNLDRTRPAITEQEIMRIRDELHIPKTSKLIVYHGSFNSMRGTDALIESMKHLDHSYHLLLLGKTDSAKYREAITANPRIHWPGIVSEIELHKYLSTADIGIVPYKTTGITNYALGFPNKFSQFLNAGLAVVLYKCYESKKIINTCQCGNIICSIEVMSIVNSIKSLSLNNDISILKNNAKQCFKKYYNWDIDKTKLLKTVGKL